VDGGGKDQLSNGSFVHANGFVDLKLCGINGNGRVVTRVYRELKFNASGYYVFGYWHDEPQVPMAPTTACGWNGACIGIHLLGQ